MPAYKAKGSSKKAFNTAVGKNMHELAIANKSRATPRPQKQMVAISISEAKGGSKKKKK